MNDRIDRRVIPLVLVAAALIFAAVALTSSAQRQGATYEWWGPTDIGRGFHFRIPVTVTNPSDVPLRNPPVAAELNVGAALIDAGWNSAPSGRREVIQGFQLDMARIRVVPMTNLKPTQGLDGRLKVHDPSKEGMRRHEIPREVLRGTLTGTMERPFHPSTNPKITVVWRVPGVVGPNEKRSFVVYFDNEATHPPKSPPGYESLEMASVDSLFGPGPARLVYGTMPSSGSRPNRVTVVGLRNDTRVEVSTRQGGEFQPLDRPDGPNPFTVDRYEAERVTLSLGQSVQFRLRATGPAGDAPRPILAVGDSTGFVPSLDGGYAGRDFIFEVEKADFAQGLSDEDAVYFAAAGGHNRETTIRVDPLDGGASRTFALNSKADVRSTPYNFTKGGRASGFNEDTCAPKFRDLPGPGLYRATVVDGGPVMAQLQPNEFVPVPSLDGDIEGRSFLATLGWSDQDPAQQEGCNPSHRMQSWIATGAKTPFWTNVSSPATDQQPSPPLGGGSPLNISQLDPVDLNAQNSKLRDHPLLFTGSTRMRLFAGRARTSGVPSVTGPIPGRNVGRDFVTLGETTVFAPYTDTRVKARLSYFDNRLNENRTENLRAGGTVQLQDRSDVGARGTLRGLRIRSHKPVLVYPSHERPSFFAGVPVLMNASIGEAMYRGYLVDIVSSTGLDPVTGSTKVNESLTYTLEIQNRARDVNGEPLADTVQLGLSVPKRVQDNWTARLDRTSVALGPGETKRFHLTVTPKQRVPPHAQAPITVSATSQGNPRVQDTITAITTVTRSFDVGLWFERVNGPEIKSRTVGAGNITTFDLEVKNQGTVVDTIRFPALDPAPGWKRVLLHDGQPIDEVTLGPGECEELRLQVTPPEGVKDATLRTTLTARSVNSPAARDSATAVTKVRAPSDLRLNVSQQVRFVDPGEEALFPVQLENVGEGTAEVAFELQSDGPSGWSGPAVFDDRPAGNRTRLPKLSIPPETTGNVTVSVAPPSNASAEQSTTIRFTARVPQTGRAVDGFLRANVRSVHDLNVSKPGSSPRIDQDETRQEIPIRVSNHGNLDEFLRTRFMNVPPRWQADAPSSIAVPRGETQAFDVTVVPPGNARPGTYNVSLALVSEDGTRTRVPLDVAVGTLVNVSLDAPERIRALPGQAAHVGIEVDNAGNVPLSVEASVSTRKGWTADVPNARRIGPGVTQEIPVVIHVPENAEDGASPHEIELTLVPDTSDTVSRSTRLNVTVLVDRPDLVAESARGFRGPAGTVVQVQIGNDGDRPGSNVRIALLMGDERVDRVQVRKLPPGATSNVTLLGPRNIDGTMRVAVDPSDRIVEAREDNNRAAATLGERPPSVPAPSIGLVVTAVAAAGLGRVAMRSEDK